MCIKHINVCCHCGELLEPHWVSCNFHLLLSRTALSQIPPLEEPLHSQCPYQKSEVRPRLRGCVNNDSCPSWLWGLTVGLGEAEDESREVTEAQEEVARAKYEEYNKEFAKNHYTRRSPPIRKNFGEFLETALDDLPSPDPEYNSDDYLSWTDDDEGEELLSEVCSLGSLSGSMEASSAPPGLGVHFEINPELLSQEIVPPKKDGTEPESETPSAENLAKEYRDLVAPIWAWFFSNDSDPDTEASQ